MEDAGLLNINSPIDLFALHLAFIPRINFALGEFLEGSDHCQVRTANHWSPYQMWVNGMLNENNPLAHGDLDEDPDDLTVYGIDPAGPSPFEDSDNQAVCTLRPKGVWVKLRNLIIRTQHSVEVIAPAAFVAFPAKYSSF
jgi:hypothetical protein